MQDSLLNILGFSIPFSAEGKQLFFAALLGFIIGLERKWHQKVASLRTFSILCMGSCLFTILSVDAVQGIGSPPYDITRIAAGIVTGIGFLGGGVIFKTTDRIEGVTTGAIIWMAAALGMACGFNKISLASWGFVIYCGIHLVSPIAHRLISTIQDVEKT